MCGTLARTHERQMQVDGSARLGIYRVFYCNRCLLLRGPGDAVTFSASPLLELLCPLPLLMFLPRVVPPLLTEKRFSPFLPRDRALTLSPTRLGGGKHEAQQRRRGGRFLPLSFFPPSLSLFLSSFFLYRRQYFRTNEAITIVISG